MEIDNCVVCNKYLKDIGEQEQGMCNHCDNVTDAIAKEQDKALILPVVSFNEVELCDICKEDVKIITGKLCEHKDCVRYR